MATCEQCIKARFETKGQYGRCSLGGPPIIRGQSICMMYVSVTNLRAKKLRKDGEK